MLINKKILVTLCLSSVVAVVALTSMKADDPEYKNLKVLPKKLTHEQLGKVMHDWSNSLGVHCDFCHARNEAEKKMDFASDAKPEKEMARKMYKMMNKLNQKYFEAKKDSLGMVIPSGVNCYTCHHGDSHPETKIPERARPGGPGPGPGGPPPGGQQGDHKQ